MNQTRIRIEQLEVSPLDIQYEIVERKGIGHPDTMCDAIAEKICYELCHFYLDKYGIILPHNSNKVMVLGGSTLPQFGAGKVTKPILFIIGGIATNKVKRNGHEEELDIFTVSIEAAKKWLKENIHNLNPDTEVVFQDGFRYSSIDLSNAQRGILLSQICEDTSVGVGYAPYSVLEKTVLQIEAYLNSQTFKKEHLAIGEEIKIMGVREKGTTSLIIAAAMVSRYVANPHEYHALLRLVSKVAKEICTKNKLSPTTIVNAFDLAPFSQKMLTHTGSYGSSFSDQGFYLLVTGSHAERGRGVVGRGNRTNGLITPNRPMSIEAPAGKMPNHPGKLYNLASFKIARRLVAEAKLDYVEVRMVSRIGAPIYQPQSVTLVVVNQNGLTDSLSKLITSLAEEELTQLPRYVEQLIKHPEKVY